MGPLEIIILALFVTIGCATTLWFCKRQRHLAAALVFLAAFITTIFALTIAEKPSSVLTDEEPETLTVTEVLESSNEAMVTVKDKETGRKYQIPLRTRTDLRPGDEISGKKLREIIKQRKQKK